MMVFGGPGVGKTTVLKEIARMCEHARMPLVSSAATGVATGAMNQAGATVTTTHSLYALPVFVDRTDNSEFLTPLSSRHISVLMEEFEETLSSGTPLAIAIDEVSMLPAYMLGQITRRIQEFESNFMPESSTQSPKLFILVGDWFQIPPPVSMPLYQSILNNFVLDVLSRPGSPEDVACRFVTEFQMFKLDKQYRSLDPKHSSNLAAMRTTDPTVYPFTSSILEDYSVLSNADVVKDQSWLLAPVVVLYNVLRHSLNLEALKHFAKRQGLPIICWRNELCGANAAALTAAEINKLYTTHPALSSFFVPGARC